MKIDKEKLAIGFLLGFPCIGTVVWGLCIGSIVPLVAISGALLITMFLVGFWKALDFYL